MMEFWMTPELAHRLAGSLLHFVWQGALIAMFAAIALRLLANRSAESRYTVAIAALLLMLAAPLVTFMFYKQTGSATLALLRFINNRLRSSASLVTETATTTTWTEWIVALWFVGVLVCSIRLFAGWRISRSLTRVGISAVPSEIQQSFNEIMERLALTTPVRLLASLRIDTPVAVGWLRPMVLVPIAALTGLDENQLRAVFAHELAHIRRHDFLVNMIQRGVESVLFYHPAVWWLSSRIRSEREHCCDDLAMQVCGDRSVLAQALLELERVRTVDPELAVSATGGRLTQRIHRVLGYRIVENDCQSAVAALLFVVAWVTVGAWQSDSSLDARSLSPRSVPAPIEVKSAAKAPQLAGAMNAFAAIATAEPVQPEPQQSNQSAQPATAENSQTGMVEGVLRDDLGKPAAGVRVLAAAAPANAGADIRQEMLFLAPANTWTDSEGRYRLEKIPAGAYYILAGSILSPTYYPGTLEAGGGKVVTVSAGATVSNINFALASICVGLINPPRPRPPFSVTGPGTLTLYVSTQVEGGGKLPIFANGRCPRLRLTKVDTNARYEMGLGSIAIAVPRNNTTIPDEYRVAVEDLPEGYTVKSITYPADEPGLRFEDVLHGTLKISSRANYSAYAGNPDSVGAPNLPIAITLTAPTEFMPDIRVTGTSQGMIVVPHIPPDGGYLPPDAGNPSDAGVYLSGKPGILFSDGTFTVAGVAPGLHRIVLYTMSVDGPRFAVADLLVGPRDRIIRDVALQSVPVIPKNIFVFSPPVLSARESRSAIIALPSLTVNVLDEATRQPISSAYATLTGIAGSLRTYAPTLRIPALLPGEYVLTAESYGYTSKTQTITVGKGDTSFDITIARNPH